MEASKQIRIRNKKFRLAVGDYELKRGIIYALECLYGNDYYLIDNGNDSHVDERAIVFRFANYFQTFLEHLITYSNYVVDLEYNRYWCDPKRVGDNLKVPDLILHQRGTDNNLVVMEFKTYWNIQTREEINKDIEGLKEMTKTKGDYGYKYFFYCYQ